MCKFIFIVHWHVERVNNVIRFLMEIKQNQARKMLDGIDLRGLVGDLEKLASVETVYACEFYCRQI